MKKSQLLTFTMLGLLSIPASVFASNVLTADSLIAYCPKSVECMGEPSSLSCHGVGENSQYWDWTQDNSSNKQWRKGSYVFIKAFDIFNMKTGDHYYCEYQYNDQYPFNVDNVQLQAKVDSHFHPLMESSKLKSNWTYYYDGKRYCYSDNAELCPLGETASIKIANYVQDKEGNKIGNINVDVSSNNIELKPIYGQHSISYYEARKVCGNVDVCKFFIRKHNNMRDDYFVLEVGLNNQMKIITISNPSNSSIKMIKNPQFNTINWLRND